MREVDTDALLRVAPFLGVGNPATATRQVVFDDENLQQMLDVYPLIARATGFYVDFQDQNNVSANNTQRVASTLASVFATSYVETGMDAIRVEERFQTDVYLVRVAQACSQSTIANLVEAAMGLHLRGLFHQTGTGGQPFAVRLSTGAQLSNPLEATGEQDLSNSMAQVTKNRLPLQIPNDPGAEESELLSVVEAGAGGNADVTNLWGLWICRRGVPLNFEV